MKKWMKWMAGLAAVALVTAVVLSQTVWNKSGTGTADYNSGFLPYKTIPTNTDAVAAFAEDRGAFTVTSANGYVWSNEVETEWRSTLSRNKEWGYYMQSLITINYYDSAKVNLEIKKYHSASDKVAVTSKAIADGRSYTFRFKPVSIQVQVDVTFRDGALAVRIPSSAITEEGDYRLMSMEVLPFFGAADHTTDGYILYPDGCGALMRYENITQRPANMNVHTLEIYGSSDMQTVSQILGSAQLPVFGIKNGENAVVAAAVTGAAESVINISPEGYVVKANRVAYEMKYRYFYNVPASNLTTGSTATQVSAIKADRMRQNQDFEAVYLFLEGDDADYSGMATAYRSFLLKNGWMKQAETADRVPISLGILMGTMEKQMLFDKKVVTTTFEQAGDMVTELHSLGIQSMEVTLLGWEKNGYGTNDKSSKPWSALGGSGGLKRLSEQLAALQIPLTLRKELVQVSTTDKGYSAGKDVVFSGNGFVLTDTAKSRFVLNLQTQRAYYTAFRRTVDTLPIGLAAGSLSKELSNNYGKDARYTRTQAMEAAQTILREADAVGRLVCEGGNAYALPYADQVTAIPARSSRFYIFDEEVPFYAMVLHGSVAYTGDAVNLFYDDSRQFLKMLEFGYVPYFELVSGSSDMLKYTECSRLFSVGYARWRDKIVQLYTQLQEFAPVQGSAMLSHRTEGELAVVEYENGWRLYVNYAEQPVTADGVTVEGQGYVLYPPAA